LETWIHLLDDVLVRWAKAAGCTVMRGFNRKGLQPVLAKRGWRTTKVVMEREL
jgi:hypothetical protein